MGRAPTAHAAVHARMMLQAVPAATRRRSPSACWSAWCLRSWCRPDTRVASSDLPGPFSASTLAGGGHRVGVSHPRDARCISRAIKCAFTNRFLDRVCGLRTCALLVRLTLAFGHTTCVSQPRGDPPTEPQSMSPRVCRGLLGSLT